MIGGLYRAATGMTVAQKQYEVAAENLANAQMPGYRRRTVHNISFNESLDQTQVSLKDQPDQTQTTSTALFDFSQGRIDETQRTLDFAIAGEGFFVVEGPDGPLLTRNGSFHVDSTGQLVTIDQLPVLGAGGPIVMPQNASSEAISGSPDGTLRINGEDFGTLRIVTVDDAQQLMPVGASLFAIPDGILQQPATANVQQGYLELSNISIVTELVALMEAARHYEVSQRAINMIEQSTQKRMES